MFLKFRVTLLLTMFFVWTVLSVMTLQVYSPHIFFVSIFKYPDLSFPKMNKTVIKNNQCRRSRIQKLLPLPSRVWVKWRKYAQNIKKRLKWINVMDNKWKKTLKFVEYMAPTGTPSVSHMIYTRKALQTNSLFVNVVLLLLLIHLSVVSLYNHPSASMTVWTTLQPVLITNPAILPL